MAVVTAATFYFGDLGVGVLLTFCCEDSDVVIKSIKEIIRKIDESEIS
ncbi:MAG: hypothetical protein JSW23_00210 [Planctomycetota bacterium]|nr:MAG: hypothetical protein JSW23_00210 [Planctomycetota bacterium]